ncbi:hypothetical protein TIFTF001_028543 [Ficus carica]|uniref:Uncharacterized protein n=1 Tax=Ficus carica TaxID=3494 RepID=A0AA88DPZ8_FICCA|nr:hypothetical protein TIFTF001_028543 [Ficus carica]
MWKQHKMGHIILVGPSMSDVDRRLDSMLCKDGYDLQSTALREMSFNDFVVFIGYFFPFANAITPRVGMIHNGLRFGVKDAAKILSMVDVPPEVNLHRIHLPTSYCLKDAKGRPGCNSCCKQCHKRRMSKYQEDTSNDVLVKREKLEKDGWKSQLNP